MAAWIGQINARLAGVFVAIIMALALANVPAAGAGGLGACQGGQLNGQGQTVTPTSLAVVNQAYACLLDHYSGAADDSPNVLLQGAWSVAGNGSLAPLPADRSAAWSAFAAAISPLLAAAPDEAARVRIDQAAIRGMANALQDDHTGYLLPTAFAAETRQLTGQATVGLGLRFAGDAARQQVFVVEVVASGPAAGLDVQPGDILEAINGQSIADVLAATQASPSVIATSLTRQTWVAGRAVRLDLYRPRSDTRQHLTLRPATFNPPDVEGSVLPGGVAYIHIWTFSTHAAAQVAGLINSEVAQGARRIVLDVREDPGGSVDNARLVASMFTHNDPLALVQSKTDQQTLDPALYVPLVNLPTDVIVDAGSASAAEFVAAALQDAQAATVVGSRTAGAIGVAEFYALDDGSGLEITIAQFLRSTGAALDGVGVQPDVPAPPSAAALSGGHDPALEAALSGSAGVDLAATFSVGTWVVTVAPGAELWSGPDSHAVPFGTQPQGSRYLVVAAPQDGRLFVYDPRSRNYAWIDATAVHAGP